MKDTASATRQAAGLKSKCQTASDRLHEPWALLPLIASAEFGLIPFSRVRHPASFYLLCKCTGVVHEVREGDVHAAVVCIHPDPWLEAMYVAHSQIRFSKLLPEFSSVGNQLLEANCRDNGALQSVSRTFEVLPLHEGVAKLEGLVLADSFTNEVCILSCIFCIYYTCSHVYIHVYIYIYIYIYELCTALTPKHMFVYTYMYVLHAL